MALEEGQNGTVRCFQWIRWIALCHHNLSRHPVIGGTVLRGFAFVENLLGRRRQWPCRVRVTLLEPTRSQLRPSSYFILSGERAEEFQPETVTRTIANYACDLCVMRSQELDLHQLIWLQVNSGVERHTALAYIVPAPRHQHSGYPIAENNVNREIDLMSLPTARICWGGHLCRTYWWIAHRCRISQQEPVRSSWTST